jgi:hypothetical protein
LHRIGAGGCAAPQVGHLTPDHHQQPSVAVSRQ